MKDEFKAQMTDQIQAWKTAGFDPVSVLRDVEIACGKANEEFAGHGRELVEGVYGGKFVPKLGGMGLFFVQTSVPPEEVKADVIAASNDQPSTGESADGKASGIQERGSGDGKEAGDQQGGGERGASVVNTQGISGSEERKPAAQPSTRPVKK